MKSRLPEHLDPQSFDSRFLSTDFSLYATNQVNNILKHGIDDQAVSRVGVEAITIDGAESLDLDDAIRAEKTKSGYCVWIHISDVSEAIPLFSPLDREALQRTTSIYRRDNIINMFPRELSNGLLSLDGTDTRNTLTLQIDLDENAEVLDSSFYESSFRNLKRYDYESFGEDYENQDSLHYRTIHLLKEISDKLRINRIRKGGIVGFKEDDRRMFIGQKREHNLGTYSSRLSHDIIESMMVLANNTTGRHLVGEGTNAIFKHHLGLDERSFYMEKPGFHKGLGVDNYTHFTSPIRRYVDVVIHRIIKALERGEEIPYNVDDLKFISDHSNNTRLKVEVLGGQIDFEHSGEEFLEKTTQRLGKSPEVYDMKHFIRNSIHNGKKMPECMKEAIKEKIENSTLDTWGWVIGVILFCRDKDLKIFLRDKLLYEKFMSPLKILNIIEQTQILRGNGDEKIFNLDEVETGEAFEIKVNLHGTVIAESSISVRDYSSMKYVKGISRREVIEKVFDYFIEL